MVEGKVIGIGNVAYCLGINSHRLHRWYKEVLSGFDQAKQRGEIGKHDMHVVETGEPHTIYVPIHKPENLGAHMAIDEKTISGETYTILSNRETNKIALMAKTLRNKHLTKLLKGFETMQVHSLTRDMAPNYEWLGRTKFMNAYHVIDKFHVIKLVLDALQDVRIRFRQKELTKKREFLKANPKEKYVQIIHENGDTTLQLLARSRGLLFKQRHRWTSQQKLRAGILFREFPLIEQAFYIVSSLRKWYRAPKGKTTYKVTRDRKKSEFMQWIKELKQSAIEELLNLADSLKNKVGHIVHYFLAKETNSKAEALNGLIQKFVRVNYGIRNKQYFLYRLAFHFS